jgi:hypothetical protein
METQDLNNNESSQNKIGIPEIYYNEPPLVQKTHDGKVYRRTGYCCQCGECCRDCPMLQWVIKNTRGICLDRINNRRQQCGQDIRGWPHIPEHIKNLSKCTYKFEDITEIKEQN